jgi:hypothetical protein
VSARTDLRGGRPAMVVPTATSLSESDTMVSEAFARHTGPKPACGRLLPRSIRQPHWHRHLDVKRPTRGCGAPKSRVHHTSTTWRLLVQVILPPTGLTPRKMGIQMRVSHDLTGRSSLCCENCSRSCFNTAFRSGDSYTRNTDIREHNWQTG